MDIKLLIKIDPETPPTPRPKPKVPRSKLGSLRKKVKYAIECIRLDYPNRDEALSFLRKVYNKFQSIKGFNDNHKVITDMITPLLSIYGNIPERSDNGETNTMDSRRSKKETGREA